MSFAESLENLQSRIKAALERSGQKGKHVHIIGASKSQSLLKIRELAKLGLTDMGENYAQELLRKAPLCRDLGLRWHFIGHLQSNKVKHILPLISSIQTLDSLELAKRIARVRYQMEGPRAPIPVLIQVNVGKESQKSGLPVDVVENLFSQFLEIEGIDVQGLMSLPPLDQDLEKMRPLFRQVKELFEKLKARHPEFKNFQTLSMGTSHDFEVAVEEGSNCIRLGTVLFGPRPE